MTTVEVVKKSKKSEELIATPSGTFKGFREDPNKLIIIGLDTKDGQKHALYDERIHLPLKDSFVASIATHGVIQPVVVMRDGDRLLVWAGRQRVRAAREVNKEYKKAGKAPILVPYVLRSAESEKDTVAVAATENGQRTDDLPIMKARKILRMVQVNGMEPGEIGATMQLSHQTVRNMMSLTKLGDNLQQLIDNGDMAESVGYVLAQGSKEEQQKAYEEMQKLGVFTVEAAKVAMHNVRGAPVEDVVEGDDDNETDAGTDADTGKPTKKGKKKGRKAEAKPKFLPPGLRPVKKILKAIAEGTVDLDKMTLGDNNQVVKFMKWLTGEISSKGVTGLNAALRKVGETPTEE